jgi:membrane protein
MIRRLYLKLRNTRFARLVVRLSRKLILPGFDGLPLYDVMGFFLKGLLNGSITTRASSVAFKFFVALFPAIIVVFTIIPYIPVQGFQQTLLDTISGFLPENFFVMVKSTIEDIVLRQRGSLLSIGFILAFYFSSNGIVGMIAAFNNTTHSMETRPLFKQYLISLLLVLILAAILLLAVAMIVSGTAVLNYLVSLGIIEGSLVFYLMLTGKWLIVVMMLFFAISFMYYLAPARKTRFRFISAGSSLATVLFIAATLGFNYYVNNFASYNAIYGSIGTLIVIMMWFYFNSLALIIGYELNASIRNAGVQHDGKQKSE